jgi:hypothetical protein
MFILSLKDDGSFIGTIDEADYQLLVDQLEEESDEDTDYYVSGDTIAMLEEAGASAGLLALLKKAVGTSEGVEVTWKKA